MHFVEVPALLLVCSANFLFSSPSEMRGEKRNQAKAWQKSKLGARSIGRSSPNLLLRQGESEVQ